VAEDLTLPESAPVRTPDSVLVKPPPDRLRPYEGRFGVAYIFLAAILAGSIVAAAILIKESNEPPKAAWSSWKPADGGISGAKEIATHVAGRYRLTSGNQVAAVFVEPLNVQNIPITYAVVRNGNEIDDNIPIPYEEVVPYTICGLGDKCAIAEGKASRQRMRLVRREAIELALYTFRYQKGIQAVTAYLPPTAGQTPEAVLLLRRSDLKPLLDRPLLATLPERDPLNPATIAPDNELIDSLTANRIFRFRYQQIPNGTAIVVLAPPEL
jgi:hypothetical protein